MKTNWNLKDILGKYTFEKLYKKLDKDLVNFQSEILALKPNMSQQDFSNFIDKHEKILEDFTRIYVFALLSEETNQKDHHAKLLKSKSIVLLQKFQDSLRPFGLWVKGKEVKGLKTLDAKNARRLFKSVPKIKYVLERSRLLAQYSLEEREEEIVDKKDLSGISTLLDLRSIIDTENKFELKLESGKELTVESYAQLSKYFQSRNPFLRKAAYKSLFKVYNSEILKYFKIYEAVVKNWTNEAKLRGYRNPISMRNVGNDVPDIAIDNLIRVCTEKAEIYREFFRMKARLLGQSKLTRFDIYAPVGKEISKKVNYNEAVDIVLGAYKKFSNGFYTRAKQVITTQHIDVLPKRNKASGAFCANITPKIVPYVLLNYTNKIRDVLVVGHELGHAIHGLYSNIQSISALDVPLPLAETASTFGELLVFDYLIENSSDKKFKQKLLLDKMADSYATVLRQSYFIKFEIDAHKELSKGLSVSDFSEIYLKNLKELFGNSVTVPKIFKSEWACIPHIFNTPFYCYSYSFGALLSMALYNMYKKDGKIFVNNFEKILSAGGSENPAKLLKSVGLDINKKSFWEESFEIVGKWLRELEEI